MRERKVAAVWDRMDKLHSERGFVAEDPGFSIDEYAARYSMTISGSGHRLQKLTREGKLIAGWTRRGGKKIRVYRFPEA